MQAAAEAVVGPENVYQASPVTGSEDFAFFSAAAPRGHDPPGLRSGRRETAPPCTPAGFDLDEEVLAVGVKVFVQAVASYLG